MNDLVTLMHATVTLPVWVVVFLCVLALLAVTRIPKPVDGDSYSTPPTDRTTRPSRTPPPPKADPDLSYTVYK